MKTKKYKKIFEGMKCSAEGCSEPATAMHYMRPCCSFHYLKYRQLMQRQKRQAKKK